jgi:hypothetical protein
MVGACFQNVGPDLGTATSDRPLLQGRIRLPHHPRPFEFCQKEKFKIQKLGDLGGFSMVKVRNFCLVKITIFLYLVFQCVAKNIEG